MCLNLTAQPEFIYRSSTFVCTELFFGLCGNIAVTSLKKFRKFTDGIVFYYTIGASIELQGEGANFLVMQFQGGLGGPSPSSLVGGRSIKFEGQNAVRVNFKLNPTSL